MEIQPVQPQKLLLKHGADKLLSLFFIVLLSPVFILAPIAIFLEHIFRGKPFSSLFYTETRISTGKPFTLIKFNIFKPQIIERLRKDGTFIHTKKLEKNGGLLLVGFLLKQVYFDELPQLFNVLSGSMSLVGPRPLNLEVYENRKILGWDTVTVLRGGITGSFQSFKNSDAHSAQKLEEWYLSELHRRSALGIVAVDIRIMIRTVRVVLRAKGI